MAAGLSSLVNAIPAVVGYLALFHSTLDIALLAGLCVYQNGVSVLWLFARVQEIPQLASVIASIAGALCALATARAYCTKPHSSKRTGFGKVLLFPCRTTHSRLFPQKHSFAYSYLAIGIPVGWEGLAGGLVSAGIQDGRQESEASSWFSFRSSPRKSWYDVDAGDYLARGNSQLGLRGKLDEFLETQGADPASFPHAYLVTAARFFGYHFNPVSFWYLYDADRTLSAMILEVNNTFGERRMYFLIASDPNPPSQIRGPPGSRRPNLPDQPLTRTVIKQSLAKDFHVSPFNSRKGSYSLTIRDVLTPSADARAGPVDNTITLKSSKGHGKMVARLFSDGPAIDPETLSRLQEFKFLASWWWVGFVTFPRILKEAWALFFRRKLHVWYRPEPLKESIGRRADSTEMRLEAVFRRYLRHLVETSDTPMTVKYVPSGLSEDTEELMLPTRAPDEERSTPPPDAQELEVKILTPVFYQRFVRYAHDLEALFCEFRESSTVWVSRPDLLPKLVLKKHLPQLTTPSPADFVYFKTIQRLRRNPERIDRPLTSSDPPKTRPREVDIRGFRISAMDGYVLAQEGIETRRLYRGTVLRLLLADRVSFGSVPLLQMQCFMLQLWLAWVISRDAQQSITQALISLSGHFSST